MYNRDWIYQTKNISSWTNTDTFIVLHDTGVIGKGNLNYLLWKWASRWSAHILITREWKAYKLADPKQITRHAGESRRGKLKYMNKYAIWIEIEGNADEPYPDVEYEKVVDVIKHLTKNFPIPYDHILKHADITREWSEKEQLRDWVSKIRKPDLTRNFWADRWFPNFATWREIFK